MEPNNSNAMAVVERTQIDAQIATAHQYPKHTPGMLSQVKANMITFACMDEDTASGCFYSLPRAGKVIQGPSIRMAEIALACYGNIRVSARVIDVDTDSRTPHVMVQAVCHDLETNVAVSIEKRRRIFTKKGRNKPDEDDINLAVNACTAIAIRDAAYKVIPLALIKPVVEAAKKIAIGDIKSLDVTRGKCIDRLNQMGVETPRILALLECVRVEDIGQSGLEVLFGLGTALKDGDITVEEAFPRTESTEVKSGTAGLKKRIAKKNTKKTEKPAENRGEKPEEKPETVTPMVAPQDTTPRGEGKWTCSDCNFSFPEPREWTTGRGKKKTTHQGCPECASEKIENSEALAEAVDETPAETPAGTTPVTAEEAERTAKAKFGTEEETEAVKPDQKYQCEHCDLKWTQKADDVPNMMGGKFTCPSCNRCKAVKV